MSSRKESRRETGKPAKEVPQRAAAMKKRAEKTEKKKPPHPFIIPGAFE